MYVTHERTVKRYKMIGYLGLPLRTYYGTLKKKIFNSRFSRAFNVDIKKWLPNASKKIDFCLS